MSCRQFSQRLSSSSPFCRLWTFQESCFLEIGNNRPRILCEFSMGNPRFLRWDFYVPPPRYGGCANVIYHVVIILRELAEQISISNIILKYGYIHGRFRSNTRKCNIVYYFWGSVSVPIVTFSKFYHQHSKIYIMETLEYLNLIQNWIRRLFLISIN